MGFIGDALGLTSRDPIQNTFQGQMAPLQYSEYSNFMPDLLQKTYQATSQADQDQAALVKALQAQAAGQGPSAAQQQLKMGQNRNVAQAASTAASQRGINPAMAARMAMQSQTAGALDMNAQAGLLRAQEQLAAQQQLGQAIQNRAAIPFGVTQGFGNLQQQQNAVASDNFHKAQGLTADAARQSTEAAYANQTNRQKFLSSVYSSLASAGTNSAMFSGGGSEAKGGVMDSGGGKGGGGGLIGTVTGFFSDEKLKKNVKSGNDDVQAFLNSIKAHEYNYKDSANIDGKKHVSPMAQELEQTSMGSELVTDTPKGKMVDYSKAGPAILASLASINERLNKVHMAGGGIVPGDHPQNDVVPAMLSPGEIVLPRSVTQSSDPEERAKEFVAAIKRGKR